ncbi:MAG: LysR family hydrogen peroxide-inducible transcriptional activator [Methylophagaceae bacterium]
MKESEKPTFKQLEYFITIAEHASFRKAGERLNVSQPTLTVQISLLEEKIGLPLFERRRSGSTLSSVGQRLLPSAKQIVEQVNNLSDLVNFEDLGPSGIYRFGLPPTLGPYLLPHFLPDLHRRYSKLQLHICEDEPNKLEEGLINGEYDLILSPLPINNRKLTVKPLFREPLFLVARHESPQINQQSVSSHTLAGLGVLTLGQKSDYHRQVRVICGKLGIHMRRDYEGTSLDGLKQMVAMGRGIAFLPALYIDAEINDEIGLEKIVIEGETMTRTHALVWRTSSPSNHFFGQLAQEMKSLILAGAGELVTTV